MRLVGKLLLQITLECIEIETSEEDLARSVGSWCFVDISPLSPRPISPLRKKTVCFLGINCTGNHITNETTYRQSAAASAVVLYFLGESPSINGWWTRTDPWLRCLLQVLLKTLEYHFLFFNKQYVHIHFNFCCVALRENFNFPQKFSIAEKRSHNGEIRKTNTITFTNSYVSMTLFIQYKVYFLHDINLFVSLLNFN